MNNGNESLPPVNEPPQPPKYVDTKNIVIVVIVAIFLLLWYSPDLFHKKKPTQEQAPIQTQQTQPTQTKEHRIPVDLVYTIKVGYPIDYVNNAFQNYKPRIDDTLDNTKGIRAYDIVDGNIFVITYKLSDGLIDHLEYANGLTKKPMNVQSLPGYPLMTKEQVDALPEDWEPYL